MGVPLEKKKSLERYYSILDDVEGFVAAASRPQPLFVWTNTLRTTSRQLIDVLAPNGYELTPLEWHPQAYRAVGAANGRNPLPLIIPCHRLIGSDGKLHGYGSGQGIATKRWLLTFEGAL